MKKLILAVVLAIASVGAISAEPKIVTKQNKDGSVTFTVPKEIVEYCKTEGGGCQFVPMAAVEQAMQEVAREAVRHACQKEI